MKATQAAVRSEAEPPRRWRARESPLIHRQLVEALRAHFQRISGWRALVLWDELLFTMVTRERAEIPWAVALSGCLASVALLLAVSGCATRTAAPASAGDGTPRQGRAVVTAVTGHAEATKPAKPPTTPEPAPSKDWQSLFDGRTLAGWEITDFAGHGEVRVENDQIVMEMGVALTGIRYTNTVPRMNYEVSLEASKLMGSDFFCGLTFPVGESCCSFIVGGWGGGVVGISSIDGNDASSNETTRYFEFAKNRWYRLRTRVTPEKIECWIDDEKVVDVEIKDRRISMRPGEIELSQPFGIATWQTTGALRNIRLRGL
jgi:hypothetical protein